MNDRCHFFCLILFLKVYIGKQCIQQTAQGIRPPTLYTFKPKQIWGGGEDRTFNAENPYNHTLPKKLQL